MPGIGYLRRVVVLRRKKGFTVVSLVTNEWCRSALWRTYNTRRQTRSRSTVQPRHKLLAIQMIHQVGCSKFLETRAPTRRHTPVSTNPELRLTETLLATVITRSVSYERRKVLMACRWVVLTRIYGLQPSVIKPT